MRCEACRGLGHRHKAPDGTILSELNTAEAWGRYHKADESFTITIEPCPACNGSGIAHCCEGDQEQPGR
jgi:hypothetical protein